MAEQVSVSQEVDENRHGGPERVRQAALEAAARLFAERGIHGVSVREIAREVGVSHTLLHLYFGSKEEILRQLLRSREGELAASNESGETSVEGILSGIRSIMMDPSLGRVLAAALVEGIVPDKIELEPAAQLSAVKRLEESGVNPLSARVMVAALACMMLGWAVGGDWISDVLGMDGFGREELGAEMEKTVKRILEN